MILAFSLSGIDVNRFHFKESLADGIMSRNWRENDRTVERTVPAILNTSREKTGLD
ncbi:MAG: hypothetical protein AAGE61_00220 [Pseudomonadota bacterium]